MKRFIKLINNERINSRIQSKKADATCSVGADDYCGQYDQAACTAYALDKCARYDLAACVEGAHDYCESYTYDTEACVGPGVTDGNKDLYP